ncbi:MAG: hypothetical protein QY320_08490 [Gammaproteobacteria bacterium]|nr:MAG: hypothetical protein QY320_08490 [Gammaproteobacteria bacterium]
MRTISKTLLVAAAVAIPGVTLADNPAWTYGELGYVRADAGNDSTDAFHVELSMGIADMFHIQGQFTDGDVRGFSATEDVDFDGYEVVFGVHPSIGANTDAVASFKFFDYSYNDLPSGPTTSYDVDADGMGFGVGLRHMLVPNVELNTMAWWNEGEHDFNGFQQDEDFTDIELEFGGRYLFTDNFSAGVRVVTNDAVLFGDSATIDVRYQFGQDFF